MKKQLLIIGLSLGFCFGSITFAGGPQPPQGPDYQYINESILLPGIVGYWHSENTDTLETSATISLTLSKKHNFDNGGWSFAVNELDPSQWTASLWLHGTLEEGHDLGFPNRRSTKLVEFDGVRLHTLLSVTYNEEREIEVFGIFSLLPAQIEATSFTYDEYSEYPDYWGSVTYWETTFFLEGRFVAETDEEARAMGAQFLPEPGTVLLISLGGMVVLVRRRQRK